MVMTGIICSQETKEICKTNTKLLLAWAFKWNEVKQKERRQYYWLSEWHRPKRSRAHCNAEKKDFENSGSGGGGGLDWRRIISEYKRHMLFWQLDISTHLLTFVGIFSLYIFPWKWEKNNWLTAADWVNKRDRENKNKHACFFFKSDGIYYNTSIKVKW